MAAGKTTLKEQALATLQAGRREISAEAQWIRNGLNPKKAVQKLAQDHTVALVVGAVALGIVLPMLLRRKSKPEADRYLEDGEQYVYDELERPVHARKRVRPARAVRPKSGLISSLMGMILKTATPFLVQQGLKFAEQFAMDHIKAQAAAQPPYPEAPNPR